MTKRRLSRVGGLLRTQVFYLTQPQNFLNEVLESGGSIAKPVDNPAALAAMLLWMAKTGRGSQLDSFILSCQGYIKATSRDDLFGMVEVKKVVKKIKAINPGVSQPVTTGTRKLARAAFDLIPKIASTNFIAARELFMLAAECVTGARIGELAGAQVGHGAFANHYAFLRWSGEHTNAAGKKTRWEPPPGVSEGDSFCEHENETSKTGVPRIMCVVSKTKGEAAIDLGKALRD